MTQKDLMDILAQHSEQALEIARKKNADYSTNENPFGNLLAPLAVNIKPEHGIIVKMLDKLSRITVLLTKDPDVSDEPIERECPDLMNYANLLWAMIEQKKKDKAK